MTTATPSLGRRVVLLCLGVLALLLVAVGVTVYVAMRSTLLHSLDDVLAERAGIVRAEAALVPQGNNRALVLRLQARGLRTEVRTPEGEVWRSDPGSPLLAQAFPPEPSGEAYVSRALTLPDGSTARVFARTSGVDYTLHRLLVLEALCSALALAVAALFLSRAARLALRPVREIAAASARTAAGERGTRLNPDRPTTELGRLALAHDDMLNALETGARTAAALERRRGTFEARWRQVLEAAQAAYVAVDERDAITDWNRGAEELFGWSRQEALRLSADALVPPEAAEGFAVLLAALRSSARDDAGRGHEVRVLTAAGRQFDAELTTWAVDRRGGTVLHLFVRDITERQEAAQLAARLAAFLEGSTDAIVLQDLDGRIRSWNDAAARSYGWTADEAVGSGSALFVPPGDLPAYEVLLARVGRGEEVTAHETERLTRAGTLVPVSVHAAPLRDAAGRVVGASSIARDITEQRFLSSTLDITLASLQQALDEATAAEARSRQFLADAAHQLRTPMAGIRACAETLLRGVPPEVGDELLATLVRETTRTARLVTALLQAARLDQGEPVDAVVLDVRRICSEEAERTRVLAPHLEVAVEADEQALALVDPQGMREALANLLDNARRLAASQVRVEVDRPAQGVVRILVTDDGPGVPEPAHESVFERFVSLDGRGGSGLGLPIARGLVRAMGGDLAYEQGFSMTLVEAP